MKILVFSNTSWNLVNFRRELIEALSGEGHEVIAVAKNTGYIEQLETIGAAFIELNFTSKSTNLVEQILLFFKIIRIFVIAKPDLVLTFTIKPNIYGALAARLARARFVPNIAGLGSTHESPYYRAITKFLYRISLKKAQICFFQNESDQAYFVENKIVDRERAVLLPGSGVNVDSFNASKEAVSRRQNNSELYFLMACRMLWSKGVAEYVEAAETIRSEFPHVSLRVVGFSNVDNPDAIPKSIIEQWHNCGVIEYLGSTDDIASVLEGVHCFVLPSYYPEGTPRSLLEAGAMSLPLITTDMPGCRNVVEDGVNGFLCEPRSPRSLTEAIRKFVLLPAKEKYEMGHRSRSLIERRYNVKDVVARYMDQI